MPSKNKTCEQMPCALLWDESFLWGLMAWRALTQAGVPFDLVRSEDIRTGKLSDYAMIFVPGGWAKAKVRTLGKKGQMEIRRFVQTGGSYLGICGGAGLATDSHLGLLPVYRTPNVDRVPSFSGPIGLTLTDHPVWKKIKTPVFHAWWPPQLHTDGFDDFHILARYGDAHPDALSADIRVEDGRNKGWPALEKKYGIFLDPERLKDKPAVVEGTYGRGKVILSLVHFDTPGDPGGRLALQNLWRYLIKNVDENLQLNSPSQSNSFYACDNHSLTATLNDILNAVDHLIACGERHLLWRRRNALLLQWRRGIRGMEYSTLASMTGEIGTRLGGKQPDNVHPKDSGSLSDPVQLKRNLECIRELLLPFAENAAELLRLEQIMLTDTSATHKTCQNEKINRLRQDLFGSARHFGGRFKPLIDAIDRLLYQLLRPIQVG